MTRTTRIGLAGDVMLGRGVDRMQTERPPSAVWGDLLPRFRRLDGVICNLECCISKRGEPWTKTPHVYHFRADPEWAVPALQVAGVEAVGLANNHALDFGEVALLDTLEALESAKIAVAGAGREREAAFAPVTVDIGDQTFVLLAVTDNTPEFAADEATPGVAYVDIDADPRPARIRRALEVASDDDFVLVSAHLGPNMVTTPSTSIRNFSRWLVDVGADLVFGHSAHVFQGIEVRDGSPIVYDAGDFVDDYAVDPHLRNDRGFLFELVVNEGRLERLRLIPTVIHEYAVYTAPETDAAWSREHVIERSREFGTTFERDGEHLVLDIE